MEFVEWRVRKDQRRKQKHVLKQHEGQGNIFCFNLYCKLPGGHPEKGLDRGQGQE